MAHLEVEELQRLAHSLAKKLRQQPGTTDELYQLFTVFNARLKLLESSAPLWRLGGDESPRPNGG